MDKYLKDIQIGSGTFGTVWLVKSKESQLKYVLKEIDLNAMDSAERKRALTEVTVLAKCRHKNIVRYKDAVVDNNRGKLSIVMEYADSGDLYSAISRQNGTPFPNICVMSWFIQICLALQYMHHRNILHRDLKTQNVFLTKNKVIKVGDFGIAKVLRTSDDLAVTSIGTPYYMSPEICSRKPYNFKSDIWALGCVLYEISCLEHPFKASSLMILVSLIQNGKRRPFANWCSLIVKELVQLLLQNDPLNRPSADEILAYPRLQPFLFKYVFHHASLETHFVDTRFLPTLEVMPDHTIKRTASACAPNLRRSHRLHETSSNNEVFYERSRSASHVSSISTHSDMSICSISSICSNKTQNKVRPLKRPLNDTFIVSNKVKVLTPPVIKIDKATDSDCGYQTIETGCLSNSDKKPEAFSPTEEMKPGQSKSAACNKGISNSFNCESFPFSVDIADSEDHANCNHTQCYQCMLDTLWKNRIKGMPNVDEYSKLKDKLGKVFKNLFDKVYQSLLYDWEVNEYKYRGSIRGFIKTLNYEQVQHIPLMMQLIQLEFQMKSLNKESEFPSVML